MVLHIRKQATRTDTEYYIYSHLPNFHGVALSVHTGVTHGPRGAAFLDLAADLGADGFEVLFCHWAALPLSWRSRCASVQCSGRRRRTGSPRRWPAAAAWRRGRAGRRRRGGPSPGAGCTPSPAGPPPPSEAPGTRRPGRPSAGGSAPGGQTKHLHKNQTTENQLECFSEGQPGMVGWKNVHLIEGLGLLWKLPGVPQNLLHVSLGRRIHATCEQHVWGTANTIHAFIHQCNETHLLKSTHVPVNMYMYDRWRHCTCNPLALIHTVTFWA